MPLSPPLFAFWFLSPWAALATGLAAISIPILIHLFSRRRFRIVTWAAMRFLLAAQKQNVRRMRLEQFLLLAVRVLILLLLVMAMASVSPWAEALWYRLFPDSAVMAAANRRTHKILVIDGSFSMGQKAGDRTCFDLARDRAVQILETSPGGDGFGVVLMAAPAQRIVPEPSDDPLRVSQEVRKLRLPHGNADLAGSLLAIDDMVKRSPAKFEAREVYFLTDLQRSTWVGSTNSEVAKIVQRIQDQARLVFVDVGVDAAVNLAVTNLNLATPLATTATVTPISATIQRFGGEDNKPVRVELLVGKARTLTNDPAFELRVVAQQIVQVPPGRGGITVSFAHKFSTPGDYAVQVRIENDALELDDFRTLIVTVKDTVPVMLVNGKPAVDEYDRATGYLRDALQPTENRAGLLESPVRPKVVSETQFGDATLGDLTSFDCVFLCDVARISGAEVRRLETHLKRGGGVIFCLGPRVDLEAYNRLLFKNGEGILPARLVGIQRASEDRPFMFYADEDSLRLPPLDAFAGIVGRFNLLEPRFYQYIRSELPTSKARGRKVLSFMPEPRKAGSAPEKGDAPNLSPPVWDPAIIEAPYQRGRVLLVTTTVNKDWNNWPDRPSLLAMMHELLHYSVAGRLRGHALLVGDPLEEFLQSGSSGMDVTIQTPDGRTVRKVTEANEDTVFFRFAETDQAGIYRATLGQHPQEYLYAVNVPIATDAQQAGESDLARVNADGLKDAYPNAEFQVVLDPKNVVRSLPGGGTAQTSGTGMGPVIARIMLFVFLALMLAEMVLAWKLGHYSKSAVGTQAQSAEGRTLPGIIGGLAALAFVIVAAVLLHTAWTGDFLGWMPESWRAVAESALGVPKPIVGESTRWRLDYTAYLPNRSPLEPWLVGLLAVAAGVLVLGVYLREGSTAGGGYRMLLAGLRFFLILVTLIVLLPQLQLWFERQGWPEIAIIIDDSESMSVADAYQDAAVREAVASLAGGTGQPRPKRLQLAQALLTGKDSNWLEELFARRKVKVHIYRCSEHAVRVVDVTEPDQREVAVRAIQELRPIGQSSRLGGAVREVLNLHRGSSLSAVIMLTDGVTTEGEDLAQASTHAAQMGVPLFFVGVGENREVRDLILHDLQVEDTVFVNDRLVFEARLTAQGYTNLPPQMITLSEKTAEGRLKELAREKVIPDPLGKPVKFRLTHRPTEAGEKTYIIEAPALPDEPQPADNNRLERTVFVREAKPSKVLFIEGPFRYEFRYIKSLLEREGADAKGNKTIDLRVLVTEADPEYPMQDKSALSEFPTKEELSLYDVVILGDVNPKDPKIGDKNLKLLVDFVREKGGGLLVIAGEQFCPNAYKDTPLADVLPIQMTDKDPPAREANRREGFRPELTPVGRLHPIFRFHPDEIENQAIWNRLAEIFWYAEGYRLQPAAEVLAVHPRRKTPTARIGASGDERHPLVVQHFVGSGRCMFFAIDETWRWRFREDELHFNQFWIQTVKYLARSGLGGIKLRLNRSTPYRRGEPIQITVRFPDDTPVPTAETAIKVVAERRRALPLPPRERVGGAGGAEAETEVETLQLAKLEGSRATYETIKTRTPEGDYRFWLSSPAVVGPKPRAECRVLPPPGEMEKIRMNQVEMERAAEQSRGKFYTLADAAHLLDDLPTGSRVSLNTPGPPWLLWNHFATLLLVLGLFGSEWILRKRKHLL